MSKQFIGSLRELGIRHPFLEVLKQIPQVLHLLV
jgi:hypothetical protein